MILRLAHTELTVADLEASTEFYGMLGLDLHERDGQSAYYRASEEFDVWSLKLTQSGQPGLAHVAFRVDPATGLDPLEELHREQGHECVRVPAGFEAGQQEALRVRTPDGHPVEFILGMDQVSVYEPDGRVCLPMRRSNRRGPVTPAR